MQYKSNLGEQKCIFSFYSVNDILLIVYTINVILIYLLVAFIQFIDHLIFLVSLRFEEHGDAN